MVEVTGKNETGDHHIILIMLYVKDVTDHFILETSSYGMCTFIVFFLWNSTRDLQGRPGVGELFERVTRSLAVALKEAVETSSFASYAEFVGYI